MTELEIFKKCVVLGMTKAGAAGCTANILHESNGRPENVENTCPMSDEAYTKAVDDGSYTNFVNDHYGYGLCQWTFYTRKEALLKYAREHGVSIGDANMQFQFLARELRESYAYVWTILTTTKDPYEAGYVMCEKFERPAGGVTSAQQRGQKAKEIYDRCKNKEVNSVYYNPQKMIDWAYTQLGYHEKASNSQLEDFTANSGDQNWNKYAAHVDSLKDFYNGPKNIGPNGAWCDIWYDDGMVICYGRAAAQYLLCQPDNSCGAGCSFSAQYFNGAGRFYKSGPQPGDQIFFGYDWNNVYHTGLVVEVTSSRVITIEGNTSDMVAKRSYALDDKNIFGYGRPRWGNPEDGEAPAPEKPAAYTYNVKLPLLRIGDKNGYVRAVQTLLIEMGYDCGNKKLIGREKPDGEFGQDTERAVADFQRKKKLECDGEVGGETWAALLNYKG